MGCVPKPAIKTPFYWWSWEVCLLRGRRLLGLRRPRRVDLRGTSSGQPPESKTMLRIVNRRCTWQTKLSDRLIPRPYGRLK